MTAGRLKEMAWGLKGARRAVKTLVPGGQCYAGDQSGAGDGGRGVVVWLRREENELGSKYCSWCCRDRHAYADGCSELGCVRGIVRYRHLTEPRHRSACHTRPAPVRTQQLHALRHDPALATTKHHVRHRVLLLLVPWWFTRLLIRGKGASLRLRM